jgi:hypothetical protein
MKKVRAAAVVVAVLLAAGELGARVLAPMDALLYQDSADPRLGFELKPGARGEKLGAEVEISAQGLRDDEIPADKPAGESRVVVVGGHEAFGLGVARGDGFVARLPRGLGAPGRARAVNLSMYSYALGQKVELACRRAAEFKPDVVVLQASEGDAIEPPAARFDAPDLKNFARAHSALARWLMEKRYHARAFAAAAPVPTPADDGSAQAEAEVQRLHDCLAATGSKLVVTLVPGVDDPAAGPKSGLRRGLESGAKKIGATFVDAGPALRRVPAGARALSPGQPFLSPAAQDALAVELGKRLAPLLPRPPKTPRRPSV